MTPPIHSAMLQSLRFSLATGLATFAAIAALAAPPAWWAERAVTNQSAAPNDYAAANIGQVKHIASKAVAEMNAKLPGGAGAELDQLVDRWGRPAPTGTTRNDYAAVTHGQLKTIAQMFYDRLDAVGYIGPPLMPGKKYPWTTDLTDDTNYAPVNIGQVKFVFSFVPALANPTLDTDGNGLPDAWELFYFGHTGNDPQSYTNNDGVSLRVKLKLGLNPTVAATTDAANLTNLKVFATPQ